MTAELLRHTIPFSTEEIARLIEPGSRVLDLGCGDGSFLEFLFRERGCTGRGIDISEEMILICVEKGIPVFQANLDEGLREISDGSYDYVIMNQTLQMMKNPSLILAEMLRVGKRAIVNYPNFGYILNRIQLGLGGVMPRNKNLPFEWHNTPNIHFCTRKDFKIFVKTLGFKIIQEIAIHSNYRVFFGKDLFASQICAVLETA